MNRFLPTLFSLLLAVTVISPVQSEQPFSFEGTPGKLPKNIVPKHYRIEIKPDLERATVSGREVIEIETKQAVNRIILNAYELQISSARLVNGETLTTKFDLTNQLVTLESPKLIPPGRHEIELVFTGKITESASGMFSISYTAPSGPRKMLATQFEATDARRVFPCFDEPAFRATFDLTAEVPEAWKAVSNMPVADTKPGATGWKRVRFERSPSMPTYLLVLVAGELAEIHDQAGPVETRIWFTEGKQEQARYALENSKRLLAYFENYFGVKFPLPKLDHIAMPGGFGGAMEHWGAITYNEGRILYDPAKSSQDVKEESFGIMAHEMAHQWFGNLVTMAWWDNLWLNEGFASWMGTKATDALNPSWNHWVRTEVGRVPLMARDARKSTHPIQQPVTSESQIGDAFDDITYGKGMFFLRMLEDYTGEKNFQTGLQRYMKRHAYSNTTTADLWAVLEEASRKPVKLFAADWTERPGLPVILATSRCVNGKQEVELRQERFTLLDANAKPLRWKVPVSVIVPGREQALQQFLVENDPLTVRLDACSDAVKINAGSRGYYRAAYDRPMFERLRGAWEKLTEVDRVNFLGDSWAMVGIGRLPAADYLDLLPALAHDQSLPIWEQMAGALSFIDSLLLGDPSQKDFQQRVVSLVRGVIVKLGYESRPGEPAGDGLLRARLIGLLSALDDPGVVAVARTRFAAFLKNPQSLTGDLRGAYLRTVGEHATVEEYDDLDRLAKAATLEEDRDLLLNALGAARDPQLARRTLESSLTKAFPPVPSAGLVSRVSGTVVNAPAAWDFMKQHHRELMLLMEGPFENMYAGSTVAGFSDDSRAAEYVEFIRRNYPPDALAKAEEAADNIRYRAHLKRMILPTVGPWAKLQQVR